MNFIRDTLLVFLDEPTTGLDPQSRSNLWEHIASLRSDLAPRSSSPRTTWRKRMSCVTGYSSSTTG